MIGAAMVASTTKLGNLTFAPCLLNNVVQDGALGFRRYRMYRIELTLEGTILMNTVCTSKDHLFLLNLHVMPKTSFASLYI